MHTFAAKAGWALAALLGLTLVAAWAGVINAGTLDPPGPLGPTMKSLDDIPGSWHRAIPVPGGADPCDNDRFLCVLNDEAVLDRETGLVWERVPETDSSDWDSAIRACQGNYHGGRMGWRLPTVSELMTLSDTTQPAGLPTGHPFTVGPGDIFWSSTRNTASAGRVMRFDFDFFLATDEIVGNAYRYWCVRAPAGPDIQ